MPVWNNLLTSETNLIGIRFVLAFCSWSSYYLGEKSLLPSDLVAELNLSHTFVFLPQLVKCSISFDLALIKVFLPFFCSSY